MDIRNEMMQTMIDCGLDVEAQHHEVATAGQSEIDLKFDELVAMADNMCMYKYIIKNVAHRHGKTVTFMPKPIFGDNGSGMHTHISLWKGGKPLFAGNGYAGLSRRGAVRHRRHPQARPGAAARSPTRRPTATSGWCRATRRRSTWPTASGTARPRCRIPMYSPSPKAKRIEFRCPDPSCNPYLAFSRADDGRASTGSRTRSTRASRSTRTSTTCRPRSWPRCPRRPARSDEALDALRERPRVPAPRRRLHRGRDQHLDLRTRRRTRSTRSPCGRTRTSSACTTTSEWPEVQKTQVRTQLQNC